MALVLALLFVVVGIPVLFLAGAALFDVGGDRANRRFERRLARQAQQNPTPEPSRYEMYLYIEQTTNELVEEIIGLEDWLAQLKSQQAHYRAMYGSAASLNAQVRDVQRELVDKNRYLDSLTPNPFGDWEDYE